jgi:serine/threonine protein kinase
VADPSPIPDTSGPDAGPPAIPDHELLRRIGRGSYGEVWLARNHTDTLRAVKIIRRAAFDDDRPYEREFTGLKNFEPLSRQHEGLVDILHLGRNDADGWFYSIMELADAAEPPPGEDGGSRLEDETQPSAAILHPPSSILAAQTYRPLTLELRIRTEGRLPVKECLRIATTLAEALRFLHEHGLVHRDIKPSNIIFVGGVPKLADVGLVARSDSAFSFVGTEGFVPPEGPGAPRADLYSLGKCLYEMAMGKDRQAFPSPPTLLDELPDRADLLELNEVITKACHPDPRGRHASLAEFAAELSLVGTGKPVRASRRKSRIARLVRWGALLLVAAGLAWVVVWVTRTPRLEVVKTFPMPGNWPARGAKLGHYYGPESIELFAAVDGAFAVVSLEGIPTPITRTEVRSDVFELDLVADVDGDGRDEAFVHWRNLTSLQLGVFNQNFRNVHPFGATGSVTQSIAGEYAISSLAAMAFIPAKEPRPPLLLAALHTGASPPWPRSVLLFDFTQRSPIWESSFPANPCHPPAVVEDGRSGLKFIIGTQSHCNGARNDDGMDDWHSYLYAVGAQAPGRLWVTNTGPALTQCSPLLVTLGGTNLIYAAVTRQFESAMVAKKKGLPLWNPAVLKVDPADGTVLARFETHLPVLSVAHLPSPDSKNSALLVPCADGTLLMLDLDLNPKRTVRVVPALHEWVQFRVCGVEDFDADGQPEILLSSTQVKQVRGNNTLDPQGETNVRQYSQNSVLVMDRFLRVLAKRQFLAQHEDVGFQVLVSSALPSKVPRVVVLDHDAKVLEFCR